MPLMVFESINNIETIGNVYDQLFIGHKIEHIITDNEKQNTEKWQQFNQLVEEHNEFHNFEFEIEADKIAPYLKDADSALRDRHLE